MREPLLDMVVEASRCICTNSYLLSRFSVIIYINKKNHLSCSWYCHFFCFVKTSEIGCFFMDLNRKFMIYTRQIKDLVESLWRKILNWKWSMPLYKLKDLAGLTWWMRRQGSMFICHQEAIKLLSDVTATKITKWYIQNQNSSYGLN